MKDFQRITSPENHMYKHFCSLNGKKGREGGEFIIEGLRFTMEAIKSDDIKFVVVSDGFASNQKALNELPADRTIVLSDRLFEKLTDTEHSQGVLAVCEKRDYTLKGILGGTKSGRFYIIAEDINDPGNLGTIIRTADAAGADGVILSGNCVEFHNPKVLRASAGAVFHIPVVWGVTTTEAVTALRLDGVKIYASHLSGSIPPYELNLTDDCAFIIGNEARGLSPEATEMADKLVKLPMPGRAESLNAGVAAGILIYEAVRQRVKI